jgi:hypothetical protein
MSGGGVVESKSSSEAVGSGKAELSMPDEYMPSSETTDVFDTVAYG